MLARLKLAREKEEDCMESLVDLGEADHDQEGGACDEDEASEVSSRYIIIVLLRVLESADGSFDWLCT